VRVRPACDGAAAVTGEARASGGGVIRRSLMFVASAASGLSVSHRLFPAHPNRTHSPFAHGHLSRDKCP
jgi:hypothetical protein